MDASSIAGHGIRAGFDRLDRAAAHIARDGDSADLAENMVDLLRARHEVRANVAVAKTADELVGTLLDVFA
jgi:hypothetical protein